jgi:hypothetical protein
LERNILNQLKLDDYISDKDLMQKCKEKLELELNKTTVDGITALKIAGVYNLRDNVEILAKNGANALNGLTDISYVAFFNYNTISTESRTILSNYITDEMILDAVIFKKFDISILYHYFHDRFITAVKNIREANVELKKLKSLDFESILKKEVGEFLA